MKLIVFLFIFISGTFAIPVSDLESEIIDLTKLENETNKVVLHEELSEQMLFSCASASMVLMHNPCEGMSSCEENNNSYCGHIDHTDPGGPDYTIICKGYSGDDQEP